MPVNWSSPSWCRPARCIIVECEERGPYEIPKKEGRRQEKPSRHLANGGRASGSHKRDLLCGVEQDCRLPICSTAHTRANSRRRPRVELPPQFLCSQFGRKAHLYDR